MSDEGREVGKPDWDNYTANTVRLIVCAASFPAIPVAR